MKPLRTLLLFFNKLITLCLISSSTGYAFTLVNSLIDAGGSKMEASHFEIRGSFGQPMVSKDSSSTFILLSGFWHPPYAGPGIQIEEYPGKYAISYFLAQSYPNPTKKEATIAFGLPNQKHVKLVVYDITGRAIITLLNKQLPAGYHKIQWDLRDRNGKKVKSGVYFYMLKTDDFTCTKKLVVVK